jgi:hypothetical protein
MLKNENVVRAAILSIALAGAAGSRPLSAEPGDPAPWTGAAPVARLLKISGAAQLPVVPEATARPEKADASPPYAPEVLALLKTAAEYADPGDMDWTLETIRKCSPAIAMRGVDGDFGFSDCPMAGGKGCYLFLSEGFVLDAAGNRTRLSSAELAGERKEAGSVDGMRAYDYADGRRLLLYPAEATAGTMLHELQHIRRACEGGGANRFTDERDAWDMQYRFYTRWQQSRAGRIDLDKTRAERMKVWQLDPARHHRNIIDIYTALGYIRAGRVTVEEQLRAYEGAPPYDARVNEEREKLGRDRTLSEAAQAAQAAWRTRQEEALLRYLEAHGGQLESGFAAQCRAVPWKCIPVLPLK